jgi:hypothetical protein
LRLAKFSNRLSAKFIGSDGFSLTKAGAKAPVPNFERGLIKKAFYL